MYDNQNNLCYLLLRTSLTALPWSWDLKLSCLKCSLSWVSSNFSSSDLPIIRTSRNSRVQSDQIQLLKSTITPSEWVLFQWGYFVQPARLLFTRISNTQDEVSVVKLSWAHMRDHLHKLRKSHTNCYQLNLESLVWMQICPSTLCLCIWKVPVLVYPHWKRQQRHGRRVRRGLRRMNKNTAHVCIHVAALQKDEDEILRVVYIRAEQADRMSSHFQQVSSYLIYFPRDINASPTWTILNGIPD